MRDPKNMYKQQVSPITGFVLGGGWDRMGQYDVINTTTIEESG